MRLSMKQRLETKCRESTLTFSASTQESILTSLFHAMFHIVGICQNADDEMKKNALYKADGRLSVM